MGITETIKQYMVDNSISYEEVAQHIGWSRQNVWDKLNKRAEPNLESIKRIAEAIGFTFQVDAIGVEMLPGEAEKALFGAVEMEQISYSAVEKILNSVGYSLKMNLPK